MASRRSTNAKSDLGWNLLAWLGFSHQKDAEEDEASGFADGLHDRQIDQNRSQLDMIGGFLARHRLPVNSTTLAAAHTYIAGNDSDLIQAIERQVLSRRPLTVEWLEERMGTDAQRDDLEQLTQLMQRLEVNIDEFSKASGEAHTATTEYSSALEQHVNELEQVNRAGEVISELATITKVMLRRTHVIEEKMLRSQAQTKILRERLDEARRSAEEDHLTGLPNRRSFETLFEHEFRTARAEMDTLSVAFCDIDNFKRINDAHGHDAGDRVIKLVADALARLSGDRCHIARHGGEEFVLLFRGVSLREAFEQLNHLREQLAERRLFNRANDTPFGQVTFSAGIADVFACGDPRAALRAADAALYRAKQEGRNRVLTACEEDIEPARADAA